LQPGRNAPVGRDLERIEVRSGLRLQQIDAAISDVRHQQTVGKRALIAGGGVQLVELREHRDRIPVLLCVQMARQPSDIRDLDDGVFHSLLNSQAEIHDRGQVNMPEHAGVYGEVRDTRAIRRDLGNVGVKYLVGEVVRRAGAQLFIGPGGELIVEESKASADGGASLSKHVIRKAESWSDR
jgi:hypothetical protein